MSYRITATGYRAFRNQDSLNFVLADGLHAILGPNNSGKSSLFRAIVEHKNLFSSLARGYSSDFESLSKSNNRPQSAAGSFDISEYCYTNSGIDRCVLSFQSDHADRQSPRIECIVDRQEDEQGTPFRHRVRVVPDPLPPEGNFGARGSGPFGAMWQTFDNAPPPAKAVAQMARDLSRCMYIPAYRLSAHIKQSGYSRYDLNIGTNFSNRVYGMSTDPGSSHDRQKFIAFQEKLGAFLEMKQLSIRLAGKDESILLDHDGMSRRLEEEGDGVADVIITALHVLEKQPTWLFIDEPELHLHPKKQAEFVQLLESLVERGVVFTTHSIGLADEVGATRTFVSRKAEEGDRVSSVMLRDGDDRINVGALASMQFCRTPISGIIGVVLCEGKHDRTAISAWVRTLGYGAKIRSFALRGNLLSETDLHQTITDYKSLCANVAVLFDRDRGVGGQLSSRAEAAREVCERIGCAFFVTDLENMDKYAVNSESGTAGGSDGASGKSKLKTSQEIASFTKDEILARELGKRLNDWCRSIVAQAH